MVNIPLARGDWLRGVAKEARILTRNRYYEQNPVLTQDEVAMLSRMGLRRWIDLGEGPVRTIYSQPGSFNDAAFVVSYETLYRVDTDGTVTVISNDMRGLDINGPISMAATSRIGTTPEYLFIADGRTLQVYMDNSYAMNTYTSAAPANLDSITFGGSSSYRWTSGSVDAGTPAGTVANPWLVALGASALEALENMYTAINADGLAGTQYSTGNVTPNASVESTLSSANTLRVRALEAGVLGNAITTTSTGGGAWASGTLTGGGAASITPVETPDDLGMISVGYIASHVICVPAQGQGVNGRFYWITPGEVRIDALNFATAERAPDPIYGVVVFGDQFWLPGQSTTEVWYFTGDADAPVLRLQGVTFDRGTWAGAAIQVKESMVIADSDGGVFQISGGLKRISNPAIEERIRKAMQKQAAEAARREL